MLHQRQAYYIMYFSVKPLLYNLSGITSKLFAHLQNAHWEIYATPLGITSDFWYNCEMSPGKYLLCMYTCGLSFASLYLLKEQSLCKDLSIHMVIFDSLLLHRRTFGRNVVERPPGGPRAKQRVTARSPLPYLHLRLKAVFLDALMGPWWISLWRLSRRFPVCPRSPVSWWIEWRTSRCQVLYWWSLQEV